MIYEGNQQFVSNLFSLGILSLTVSVGRSLLSDHRTDNYFMVSSPLVPLAITISYLYFVRDLGPKLMENRKPFDIANIMRVYNVVQIVTNSYVAVMVSAEQVIVKYFASV